MAAKSSHQESIKELCNLFKLLSDPTRLEILLQLTQGEFTVTDICESLGLPQPTVSHHLGLLRMGHCIVNKRNGKSVIYSLSESTKGSKSSLRFTVGDQSVTLSDLA
jgi:DNA-binding transcriptional ArsR family regulator